MIKKRIGLKIAFTLIPVLLISFIVLQYFIVSEFKSASLEQSKRSLNSFSQSVFQTVRAAMNLGDPEQIDQALKDAEKIEGIKKLEIHKSQAVIDGFGIQAKPSSEELIKNIIKNPQIKAIDINDEKGHRLRLLRPLVATNECLGCHVTSKKGDVLGVMDMTYSFEKIDKDIKDSSYVFLFIFLISLIITSLVVMWVLKKVVGDPINILKERVENLSGSEGDLTARVEVNSEDEIGQVASHINKFIEKIQNMIVVSKESANEVNKTDEILNNNVVEITKSAQIQTQSISKTFNVMKDVEKNLGVSEELAISTAEDNIKAFNILENMSESLHDVVEKILESSQNEQEMSVQISSVVSQTEQIKGVLEMIKDIADQTNLLALNAAIEAARAGEHGRGFAVVADEVRKLAERTQKSLSEIDSTISVIVQGVTELSSAMQNNAIAMQEVSSSAENVRSEADKTKEKTKESIEISKEASKKVVEISHLTNVMMEQMKETFEASSYNEKIADDLAKISKNMTEISLNLEETLSSFKV
ncbi:methyl-accepting chemotaxis protein [Sulfurospirillum sp. 1307]